MSWLPLTDKAASEYTSGIGVSEQIDIVQGYLQGHINSIHDILLSNHDPAHIEILAFATLDTIGSLAFPDKNVNGGAKRIRMLVEQHCGCPELLNYSVPAILEAIDDVSCERLHCLRDRCLQLFNDHWHSGCMPEIGLDLCSDELKELTGELEITIRDNPKISLGDCRHSRMLASKRNAIMHELVRKGLRSLSEISSPHYICFSGETGKNAPEKWDLVHPLPFLLKLCRNGLRSTFDYLRDQKIGPHSILIKNSSWLGSR